MDAKLSLKLIIVAASLIGIASANDEEHRFRVTSDTFADGGQLPLSMIYDAPNPTTNLNECTASGAMGEDSSPELKWVHAPPETRSFIVTVYDTDASFTHWAVYNIPASTTHLPFNAGVPGSTYGEQISNDFGDLNYDGPCPPTTAKPLSHHYVFTVYALRTLLPVLPTHGDFPPGAEALYHALIAAARHEDILATTSIDGFYSAAAGT